MRITVACPAKLNLFLSVGPPEASGYHPIRTVFQAIGLFDELHIETSRRETTIHSDWEELPADNTLARTLRLAAEVVDVPQINVVLTKRIPPKSGLGGGSSDAAGLLRAMTILTGGKITTMHQLEIARAVGADVPFFLVGGCAKGEGYGDLITPLPDAASDWFLVCKPEIGCDTKGAYASLDQDVREWKSFPTSTMIHNDFESVAPEECHRLIAELSALSQNGAGLTGSGSAVFAKFSNRNGAEQALSQLALRNGISHWIVRALTRKESVSHRIDER